MPQKKIRGTKLKTLRSKVGNVLTKGGGGEKESLRRRINPAIRVKRKELEESLREGYRE